jgi:hypothetical protein
MTKYSQRWGYLYVDKILYYLYYYAMGNIPKPDIKRDKLLIADYMKKEKKEWVYTISQLGVKYARVEDGVSIPLTPTRIHQILCKYDVPKKRVGKKKKKKIKQ